MTRSTDLHQLRMACLWFGDESDADQALRVVFALAGTEYQIHRSVGRLEDLTASEITAARDVIYPKALRKAQAIRKAQALHKANDLGAKTTYRETGGRR